LLNTYLIIFNKKFLLLLGENYIKNKKVLKHSSSTRKEYYAIAYKMVEAPGYVFNKISDISLIVIGRLNLFYRLYYDELNTKNTMILFLIMIKIITF
jgi:hypothetical protein